MNSLKWAITFAIVILGLVGNYQFSDQQLLYRVLALLALAAMAVMIALQTDKGKAFSRFALEAKNELRKVVWPSKQETLQTTLMVLAVVAIVALILWVVDILLLKIVAWLTSGYGVF